MSRQGATPKATRPRRRHGGGRHASQGDRAVALFLLGALVFNAPILLLFNVEAFVLGIPVLYVYLFLAWGALIVLMALNARHADATTLADPPSPHIHGPPPPRPPDGDA